MIPEVVNSAGGMETRGLAAAFGAEELRAEVEDSNCLEGAAALLRAVLLDIAHEDRPIKDGDIFARGFWSVRFRRRSDAMLEAWEPAPEEGLSERRGVDFAVRAWYEQQTSCERFDSAFVAPRPDQLAAVSAGVLEGELPTEGVRYPSPDHMSGWWITTADYDGDVSSIRTEHLHHIVAARPELLGLVALDFGWRWHDEDGERKVWFDSTVAGAEP